MDKGFRKAKRFVIAYTDRNGVVTIYRDEQSKCLVQRNTDFKVKPDWNVYLPKHITRDNPDFAGSFMDCKRWIENKFPDEGKFLKNV